MGAPEDKRELSRTSRSRGRKGGDTRNQLSRTVLKKGREKRRRKKKRRWLCDGGVSCYFPGGEGGNEGGKHVFGALRRKKLPKRER